MSSDSNTRLDAATLSAEIKSQIANEFVAELTQVHEKDTIQSFINIIFVIYRLWRMHALQDALENLVSEWKHLKKYCSLAFYSFSFVIP